MASGLAALGALFGVAGGWIGPGLAVACALGLGRDRLERAVLAVALGRVLLAAVSLAAAAAGAPQALVAWSAAGLAAGAWAVARTGRDPACPTTESGVGAALAFATACAALLLHAVVLRNGLGGEALLFFGRDSANDPFVYGAYALALRDGGLPLANPFAGGAPVQGSFAPFAVLAGLSASGATPMAHLAYRVVPALDAVALGATAIAFVRALGAPRAAWWLAPLALLAGDPSPVVAALLRAVGVGTHAIDSFALFGPYLTAVNPITPGMQALFCALLLLARRQDRRTALVAGVLVGTLFEIKLFLWATALAGLFAAAWIRPPAAARSALRWASLAGLLASVPSIAERVRFATAQSAQDDTGFGLCVACLPRYLLRAAWGDGELSFAAFRAGAGVASIGPRAIAVSLVFVALALGVRALALGELARGLTHPVKAAPYRILAAAIAAGFALALAVATPPHYLNAAQFTWVAVFGLAPLLAVAAARWLADGRWLPLALATLLALPGSADALLRLGYGAAPRFRVTREELALADAVRAHAAPGDVVLEPSMIADTDVPSAIPLYGERPVFLSLLSAVGSLPPAERDARYAALVAFFVGDDAAAARRALAQSGAALVLVPATFRAPALPRDALEPIAENAAGRLYRVRDSARLAP
jgi:hypothetical protein